YAVSTSRTISSTVPRKSDPASSTPISACSTRARLYEGPMWSRGCEMDSVTSLSYAGLKREREGMLRLRSSEPLRLTVVPVVSRCETPMRELMASKRVAAFVIMLPSASTNDPSSGVRDAALLTLALNVGSKLARAASRLCSAVSVWKCSIRIAKFFWSARRIASSSVRTGVDAAAAVSGGGGRGAGSCAVSEPAVRPRRRRTGRRRLMGAESGRRTRKRRDKLLTRVNSFARYDERGWRRFRDSIVQFSNARRRHCPRQTCGLLVHECLRDERFEH